MWHRTDTTCWLGLAASFCLHRSPWSLCGRRRGRVCHCHFARHALRFVNLSCISSSLPILYLLRLSTLCRLNFTTNLFANNFAFIFTFFFLYQTYFYQMTIPDQTYFYQIVLDQFFAVIFYFNVHQIFTWHFSSATLSVLNLSLPNVNLQNWFQTNLIILQTISSIKLTSLKLMSLYQTYSGQLYCTKPFFPPYLVSPILSLYIKHLSTTLLCSTLRPSIQFYGSKFTNIKFTFANLASTNFISAWFASINSIPTLAFRAKGRVQKLTGRY